MNKKKQNVKKREKVEGEGLRSWRELVIFVGEIVKTVAL